jgi:tRNA (adenine37-N6)-methyltransferase
MIVEPIGYVHSPYKDKHSAPRQPSEARDVQGVIELCENRHFEDALADIESWSHLWVLFWFHQSEHWRPKVSPPRSDQKRGLFATRSPYRPNPIGLSVVRFERVDGLHLHVRDIDMLDGTPVLDIKPYVPYTDAIVEAGHGWLAAPAQDPMTRYVVAWGERALAQLDWITPLTPYPLRSEVERVLSSAPTPHAYRRIKQISEGLRLSIRDFRIFYKIDAQTVRIDRIETGYPPRELNNPKATATAQTPLDVHRALMAKFYGR